MNAIVAPTADEIGKFRGIINAFPHIWSGSVLDVGCRSGKLKDVLPGSVVSYCGVDLQPPVDVIADLGKGLPFADRSFSVVAALDVLEHIEEIYFAFQELCRVAQEYIVLTLPNAYEIKTRIHFLMGLPISGKYGLPIQPPSDRHRWLFSLWEARAFVNALARENGFHIMAEGCLVGPRRRLVPGSFAVKLLPNLFGPCYLVLLQRKQGD